MYRTIMLPVDMAHIDRLDRSLTVAADLAKHWDASVVYVGVTTEQPSATAHSPAEFREKLEAFAAAQGTTHGHTTSARSYASHDPTSDLDAVLKTAVGDTGADLVVMAAYVPSFFDRMRRSHENVMAARSGVSVLIVR